MIIDYFLLIINYKETISNYLSIVVLLSRP
nr:MAG TPA: hypothetical protein [Caudoviricetes sp.]